MVTCLRWCCVLGLVTAMFVLPVLAQDSKTTKQIVFVCEHGAAKSIIAAAHFNKLAEERGLPQRAIARGTNPDENFAPAVLAGLQKDGLKAPAGKPTKVTLADVVAADRVVTMGCALPQEKAAPNKVSDWADISSPSKSYDAARNDIVRHITELVDQLSKER